MSFSKLIGKHLRKQNKHGQTKEIELHSGYEKLMKGKYREKKTR
jgi:hypothetical protein